MPPADHSSSFLSFYIYISNHLPLFILVESLLLLFRDPWEFLQMFSTTSALCKRGGGWLEFRNCLYLNGRDGKSFLIFALLAFVINYLFVWPFEVLKICGGPQK